MATLQPYRGSGTSDAWSVTKLVQIFIDVSQRSKRNVVNGACTSPWYKTEASRNTVIVGLSTDFALLEENSGAGEHTENNLVGFTLPYHSFFLGDCMDCGRSSSGTPCGGMYLKTFLTDQSILTPLPFIISFIFFWN